MNHLAFSVFILGAVAALPTAQVSFWTGSANYQKWVFGIGLAGLIVSVFGFSLAWYHLSKVRKAAEAAELAAQDTSSRFLKLKTLIDLSVLRGYSSSCIVLLRAKNPGGAAVRALDLREGIAKIRTNEHGKSLQEPKAWQDLITRVAGVQETLDQCALLNKEDSRTIGKCLKCLKSMSQVHEELSELAATAEEATGDA